MKISTLKNKYREYSKKYNNTSKHAMSYHPMFQFFLNNYTGMGSSYVFEQEFKNMDNYGYAQTDPRWSKTLVDNCLYIINERGDSI